MDQRTCAETRYAENGVEMLDHVCRRCPHGLEIGFLSDAAYVDAFPLVRDLRHVTLDAFSCESDEHTRTLERVGVEVDG